MLADSEPRSFTTRVRRVWPDGTITTIAGGDHSGFAGDGGPARDALFSDIARLAALPDGAVLVADSLNGRVRRIEPDGTIHTIAGTGQSSILGEGGPANLASVAAITAVAITGAHVHGRRVAVDYASTVRGRARLQLYRRDGRRVAASSAAASPHGHVASRGTVASGVYRAHLVIQAANGAAASSDVGLLVGRLHIDTARRALRNLFAGYSFYPLGPPFGRTAVRCAAISRARVDCEARGQSIGGRRLCAAVFAVQTNASGLPQMRAYACTPGHRTSIRRHPVWRVPPDVFISQIWPPFFKHHVVPAPLLP